MKPKLSTLLVAFVVYSPTIQASLPTNLLFQYPEGTWIENLAVRQDGSLLFTSLDSPGNLHSFDPFYGSEPTLIASFPSYNSTLGIVETTIDDFYILTANFTLEGPHPGTQPRSNAVFHVKFIDVQGSSRARVNNLVEIDGAGELNGLTAFNDTLLLAADSTLGAVWAVDTRTGTAFVISQDPLMMPTGADSNIKQGINGVHFRGRTLYFTNTHRSLLGKLDLDQDANPSGPAVVIAYAETEGGVQTSWDDFTLGCEGEVFAATPGGNMVQLILPNGVIRTLAGALNSTTFAQPTSVKFGRTARDSDVLYVTTAGGLGEPVVEMNQPMLVGAQIVAIKVEDYDWEAI